MWQIRRISLKKNVKILLRVSSIEIITIIQSNVYFIYIFDICNLNKKVFLRGLSLDLPRYFLFFVYTAIVKYTLCAKQMLVHPSL